MILVNFMFTPDKFAGRTSDCPTRKLNLCFYNSFNIILYITILYSIFNSNEFWSPTKFINFYKYLHVPYLGLYNAQDFTQILYFVGGVRIINRNNVFHSFPDGKSQCFFVYGVHLKKLCLGWPSGFVIQKHLYCSV
jgi:hypothetical protein